MKSISKTLINKKRHAYYLLSVFILTVNVICAQTPVHNFAANNNEFSVKENFTITVDAPYQLEIALQNTGDAAYLSLSPIANGYQCTITRDAALSHKVQVVGTVKDASNVVVLNYNTTFTVQQARPTNSNAAWMSGSWGVRFVIDGGKALDNKVASGYDYNLGIAQIRDELTNVDFVISNFTHNATGYYFTLRDHPYVDIAAEIHPEMVPSKENEQIIINTIQQLKAAGKKVLLYLASDGPHARVLPESRQKYTTEWLNYCQTKFGGDEAAAWRNIVKGYAERFNEIGIDGFWIDHVFAMPGAHPQAHEQFKDMLLAINPNWTLTFYQGSNSLPNVTVESNGYDTGEPVAPHPVPAMESLTNLGDFTDGHPTSLPTGAPVNSWGYEEYTFGLAQEQPWVTVDGKQILRFWFGPIRQSWNNTAAPLMFDTDQAYRWVRTMTDAGASYCFAITMDKLDGFKGGINQEDFNVLKEVNTRMEAMTAFTPYTRPLGAYISEEAIFSGSGNWNVALNWSDNVVPTSTKDVVIQQSSEVCVLEDATVHDLLIEEGANLYVLNSVNFNVTGTVRGDVIYVDTAVCISSVDAVDIIDAPEAIVPGETYAITVNYSATQERDIKLVLQYTEAAPIIVGGASFNQWGWTRDLKQNVVAGSGTLTFNVNIPADYPLSIDEHQWMSWITTPGGGWLDEANQIAVPSPVYNVDIVSELSVSEFTVTNPFVVYPNPAKTELTVNAKEAGEVEIVSLNGKVLFNTKIKSSSETVIDIEKLSSGIYLCRYTNARVVKVVKLVKL